MQAGLCSGRPSVAGRPVPPGFLCAPRTPGPHAPILNYRKEGGSREPKTSPYLKTTHIEVLASSSPRPRGALSLHCVMELPYGQQRVCLNLLLPQQPPSPKGLLFKMWANIRSTWDAFENSLLGPTPLRPAEQAPPVGKLGV